MLVGMKLTARSALAAAVIAGACFAALPASATTFDFSYVDLSDKNINGSGVFSGYSLSSGEYQLTGVSGVVNDDGVSASISGLSSYAGSDNLLYYPSEPYVDFGGVSFATQKPDSTPLDQWNIYWNGYYGLLDFNSNATGYPNSTEITFSVSQDSVSATPLPAALPLFAGGLGMIALIGRRKKRPLAAPIANA